MLKSKRIPLLKDHHTHPSVYAVLSDCLNLSRASSKEEALLWIRNLSDEINIIVGWNNSLYSFDDEELNSFPPVFICNVSFHSFLMNESAKEICSESYEELVTNIENQAWVERNLAEISKFVVNIKQCTKSQLSAFYGYLLQQGVWYVEDMLLPSNSIAEKLKELGYLERTLLWADMETFNTLDLEAQSNIYGIKLFVDGAIGAKTAAMKQPYLTGGRGILIYSDDELYRIINKSIGIKKPFAIHALGDMATEQVINVLFKMKQSCSRMPVVRIEHSQFISKGNAEKAKSLGIILSMQPNFSHDSVQYSDRLSEEYLSTNNPFRMLIDEVGYKLGDDLILGSDGMPHGVNYALQMSLFPPFPGQKLTLEEFIAGYCMPDMEKGYIEVEIDEENQSVSTKVTEEPDESCSHVGWAKPGRVGKPGSKPGRVGKRAR